MDNTNEKFQIVDEHWQMFEDMSQNDSYKNLRSHADELGKTMKDAFVNVLEIQEIFMMISRGKFVKSDRGAGF